MSEDDIDIIAEKLDTLIQLIAVAAFEDRKQMDQIRLMGLCGMKPARIAQILGTTPNTVSVALSNLRKEKRLVLGGRTRDEKKVTR